ncbi:hypothetical protein WA026_009957 [Henosepilachna vigintioctopunctata]|uniref:Uncharacterized protein n=1 Tax=Henosepilachna vigintioctopunctata TaxID=420089 RepID=A0AAW1TS76_9CUCU
MSKIVFLKQSIKALKAINEWQKNISVYNFLLKVRYPLYASAVGLVGFAYARRDYWMPNTEEMRKGLQYQSPIAVEIFSALRAETRKKLVEEMMSKQKATS